MEKRDIDRIGYDAEERYFSQLDQEAKEKFRKRLDREREERLMREHGLSHWMRCPKCGSEMEEIPVRNLKLDRCKGCRGIFFDAGELELLIRAEATEQLSQIWPLLH